MVAERKRKRPDPARAKWLPARLKREVALVLTVPVVLYLLACLATYDPTDPGWSRSGALTGTVGNVGGLFGAWLADLSLYLLGFAAFLLPILLGVLVLSLLLGSARGSTLAPALRLVGAVLLLPAVAGIADIRLGNGGSNFPEGSGGIVGAAVARITLESFGPLGTTLLLLALTLVSLTLATGLSWFGLMDRIGRLVLNAGASLGRSAIGMRDWRQARVMKSAREDSRKIDATLRRGREPVRIEPPVRTVEKSERASRENQIPLFNTGSADERPPLALLDEPKPQPASHDEETLAALSRQIELKLRDFRIEVNVVDAFPGPVVTRFEMEPAPGIKGSQISNLDKDIARGLSVKSVRVVDVIPGKSVIGLEIPNARRETIFLSEILRSREYDRIASPLALALGKDIGGRPHVVDLARMPHLLVAGTTGAGKSVALNAMVLSLLYKSTARDVRMLMIDPKMLELSVYEGVPHLLAPVVTDMKEAANGLRWCVAEMERRYRLMSALGVRNLVGFNRKVREAQEAGTPLTDPLAAAADPSAPAPVLEPLPYLVVIVDEFADMMMIVGKKVEELIARLAQKARAAGIHLILATQRPSVDVLTGLIKANVPTRIAFQVSSKVDSRVILDQGGAETLLGHGDMLYLPAGTAVPERVHGAFVSDEEVHRVVAWLRQQSGTPEYIDGVLEDVQMIGEGMIVGPTGLPEADSDSNAEIDPLYDQAVRIVTESRRASISGVQRRLKVGYNRAARMIEAMEAAGIVTGQSEGGDRKVIAPPPPSH